MSSATSQRRSTPTSRSRPTRKCASGLDETAARRAAAVELGGVEQVKEQVREVRFGHFLETRLQDLRFAFRTLRKSPVFSLTVVLVLGIGIGSTVLMFALVNSLLLRGPAFPEAERLYMLWQKIPQEDRVSFSPNEFMAWEKQSEVFQQMAAFTGTSFTISGRGEPDLVRGQMVTPSFFEVLRAAPSHGRAFLAEEGTPGQDHAVILSHGLWRQKFGSRTEVLGERVMMDGKPFTVVGVMPESFAFPDHATKFWVPAALRGAVFQEHPDAHFLRVLGRVKPGISRGTTPGRGRRSGQARDRSGGQNRAPLFRGGIERR